MWPLKNYFPKTINTATSGHNNTLSDSPSLIKTDCNKRLQVTHLGVTLNESINRV